jgi:hypothetical protein
MKKELYEQFKAENREAAAAKSALAQRKRIEKLDPDDPRPTHNRASLRRFRKSLKRIY